MTLQHEDELVLLRVTWRSAETAPGVSRVKFTPSS